MIQNTALLRWHRATARQLDAQFITAITIGMNCSPFEAEAIRDTVYTVYAPLLETADALLPGQVRVSVIDARVPPNVPLARAQQCLVTLTLDAGAADRQVRQDGGVLALRRHRFLRVCEEAFQQGGLLTLEAIADLFNCAVRTLVSDLAAVRAQGSVPPLRSTVKDMGRALTHRRRIVELWLAGQEYTEIMRTTHHSLPAIANYVEKFKRVAALVATGLPLDTVALIVRISPALAQAYQHLLTAAQPVPHRREELTTFLKKTTRPVPTPEVRP